MDYYKRTIVEVDRERAFENLIFEGSSVSGLRAVVVLTGPVKGGHSTDVFPWHQDKGTDLSFVLYAVSDISPENAERTHIETCRNFDCKNRRYILDPQTNRYEPVD